MKKLLSTLIVAAIMLTVLSSCAENSNHSAESDTGNAGLTEASDSVKDSESNSDEMQSDNITEQANEIITELTPALAITDDILSRQNIKFDEETIEAEDPDGYTDTYYKYPAPYDTVDACMEAMHECYTDEMCEKIYSAFFDMNNDDRWSVFYVNNDGVIYVSDGEIYHIRFTVPITSAEKDGEDKIIAKTSIIQQDGNAEFEIVLKKEDGVWKVDSLGSSDSEGSTLYATPGEN